jgi:sialate O-acetylesterase
LAVRADVKLPSLVSEGMVLQQGVPVRIWGWADEGEQVTVKIRNQTETTIASQGKWAVTLAPMKAGGPFELAIFGKNKIAFKDVLVGEVWVCSGQSNMEWPLSASFQPEADIAAATNAALRLFLVPKANLDAPTVRIKSAWTVCSPESAKSFSAVGYYFGRDLQQARQVPVGLIGTYWGGSPAEVWMSREALEMNPRYQTEILDAYATVEKNYRQALLAWEREKADAEKEGKEFKKNQPWRGWKPTELYNGMIAPLIPYPIKGAIWYQGESNAGRAEQYRSLFADMIRNWRRDWGVGDLTFLSVQLAPFTAIKPEPGDSDWAELREAQLLSTKVLPKVGMAVITDVGEENDIHPRKKAPVGARLALAARAITYGEKITAGGPLYRSLTVKGDRAILRFDNVGRGLEARGGELKGFAICGDDHKWVWAKAEIQPDNTVAVSSPDVPKPIAVRFGWANFPVVNLWNKDGLPATPFRTDDFPLTTAGRK